MNPLRKIADTDERKIHRLIILVECLIVYIVIASAVGAWFVFGLIDSNHNKADNVGQGLSIIACNAGLARENSILDHAVSNADVQSNIVAAKGYFKIMPAFGLKYPHMPLDRYGERCPYPQLTREATLIAKNSR